MRVAETSDQAAKPQRLAQRTLVRHVVLAFVATVLVLGFAAVHIEFSPMHRWNRAFGDASMVLVALSVGLGPLARFLRGVVRVLPFRREFGIYGCLLAIVHTAVILTAWVEWDLMRLFGFEWHPELLAYVMFQHGFGLANAIGLAALILAILLGATSSDIAMRRLGVSGWKFLQMGILPLWWLTVAHIAYFLFMHFLSFHRETPPPNTLQPWFLGLVAGVFALRGAAYVLTVRAKGKSRQAGEGGDRAPI